MRYYVIAGERSGDLHAGNLVKALKTYDTGAQFQGFGGDYLQQQGVELTAHYRDLAFMGFLEVLKNLRTINRYMRLCQQDIVAYNPDVVILVDYGGFNMRIAKFCKAKGIRVFYYISPKVWAWNQGRAWKLKATVDRMFVILPFEKDFFKKFDWNVDYVGNPVLDAVKSHQPTPHFKAQYGFRDDAPLVALLPGSRRQELQAVIPCMAAVAKRFRQWQFAVAAVEELNQDLYSPLRGLDHVKFITNDTYNLLLNASAVVVTSGTATLETALFNAPQVVIYKTSTISYQLAKHFIRVPFISLVNLIAGKKVVEELIQHDMNEVTVSQTLERLIVDKSYREKILHDYAEIYKLLDIGSASENAARLMFSYLQG